MDLGGDINISGNIQLYGQIYAMFVNADAMGKSMQGATGSIVFGTVMNSILTRYNHVKNFKLTPYEWLENVLNELQKVFAAFDGSMYVSCFMGIINSVNGKLYYFNAEHPSPVLYRDSTASFIDEEPLRKLGFPTFEETIELPLRTQQLQKGDIIIIGSDGKDDLDLGLDSKERSINSDETLFLDTVKKADGDLEKIYSGILSKGQVIDDVSLIRVEFLGIQNEIQSSEIDYKKIKNLIQKSYFQKALDELESVFQSDVGEEHIFLRALCLERLGLGTAAKAVLEKEFSSVQNHIPSVKLLSYIHYRSGDYDIANELLKKALNKGKDENLILPIIEKIKRKQSIRDRI